MVKTTMTSAPRTQTSSDATSGNTSVVFGSIDNISASSSLRITVHKLNSKNYSEWVQSIKLAIDGRGKFGCLTKKVKQPTKGDPTFKIWRSKKSLVMFWLLNYMEATIGKTYMFLPTAKTLWDAIRETYSKKNSSQSFELK